MAIYLVSVNPQSPFQRLVKADTRAQAISHVIGSAVSVETPGPEQLLEFGAAGVKLERAGEEVAKAAE